MFITELRRHLAVSSIAELGKSLKMDAGFWNVVSIREPSVPKPAFLRYAKRVYEVIFEDWEQIDPSDPGTPPRREHLAGIFHFIDGCPGEPVLVHCLAGLSRSPAVALTLIVRGLTQGARQPSQGRHWRNGPYNCYSKSARNRVPTGSCYKLDWGNSWRWTLPVNWQSTW